MNFFEAMKAADEGKIVKSCLDHLYKKKNNILYQTSIVSKELWLPYDISREETEGDWILHKEPKEEKGLWVSGWPQDVNEDIYMVILRQFDKPSEKEAWVNALKTFMQLKGHYLAVKADDNYQFFINITLESAEVCPFPEKKLPIKIYNFSPMFETMADAEQALEDIGEENLIKMAKVFQGIYE